ncbi:MAG: major capsid protein, partial [Rubrobacteraceae bacterium]
MALLLSQAETLSENDLRRGVLETFVIESPFMEMLDFMEIEGNAYAYNEEATLPGVEFRAVNAAYSESTGTVNQKSEKLVILGGDADVDKFIQLTRSNLNDQRALQLTLKAKALVYRYQDGFINGDVAADANSFDGL